MSNNALNYYDVVIDANSIENISNGWTVEYTDEGMKRYEAKKDAKSCVVGVVGNKNKGKSFLLTKLAGMNLPSGHSITTKGLSVKYPEDKYKNIILLDTAGLETPLTETEYYNVEQEMEKFIAKEKNKKEEGEKIETQEEEEEDEHMNEIDKEDAEKEEAEKQRAEAKLNVIEKFARDKQITEYFLQKFILQESDILVLLVEQLNYSDQKLLNRIKNQCKGKLLFVVHNLYNFVTVKQVEDYLEETLMKSLTFKLKRNVMREYVGDVEQYFYTEEYYRPGSNEEEEIENDNDDENIVVHLIMANDGPTSEAGKRYNQSTIKYLKQQITAFSRLKTFPVIDKLKDFFAKCSPELIDGEKIDKSNLEFENKKIKLKDGVPAPTLKKCLFDELGISKFQGSLFEPNYRSYISKDRKRFVVELEMTGTIGKKGDTSLEVTVNTKDGFYFFKIAGKKKIEERKSPLAFSSRQKGNVNIIIRVSTQTISLASTKVKKISATDGILQLEFELHAN